MPRTYAIGVVLATGALLACAGARQDGGRAAAADPTPPAEPGGDAREALASGEALLASGRIAEAEAAFARAAELAPRDDRPPLALARARFAAGDPAGAVRNADAALSLRDSAEARAVRGRALARARRFDAAAADIENALASRPDDASLRALLAAVHANRGDRLAAAAAFSAAAAGLGQADAARAVWRELRFVAPDPLQPEESLDRCTRAYVALLEGQPLEALREATNGMRFAPRFHWCGAVRAEALWASRDPAGAERILRWAIAEYAPDREPLRADAKGVLAELLSLRADTAAEAAALARETLAARGERGAVLAALMRACEAAGDEACARDAAARLVAQPSLPSELRTAAEERLR